MELGRQLQGPHLEKILATACRAFQRFSGPNRRRIRGPAPSPAWNPRIASLARGRISRQRPTPSRRSRLNGCGDGIRTALRELRASRIFGPCAHASSRFG